MAALSAILSTTIALCGCGIKNLPTAPSSGETPAVAVEEERGGNTNVLGLGGSGVDDDTRSVTGVRRIAGVEREDTVSAAEVTRNSEASRRSFFLDPLLN